LVGANKGASWEEVPLRLSQEKRKMPRPLEGIRILEIGHQLAGPFCGMLLGDLGADVIKIERPNEGDHTRVFKPQINGESACFAALNRNKRSIVIDLKQAEGREIVLQLIAKSGALIENNRPGALAKLGLGPEHARAVNEAIVYVSLSGFGQSGPYSKRAGVNFIVESFSGSLALTGDADDIPMHPGIQTGDILGGMYGTYAVLAGLINSLRHKEGQIMDVSLVEALLSAAVWETTEYLNTGHVPPPLGHRHRMSTPSQFFQTSDGRYLAISAANDDLFGRFLRVLGLESHLSDPRFATHVLRKENEDSMVSLVSPAIRKRTATELEVELMSAGIPCSLYNDLAQAFDDPHIKERGVAVEVTHPRIGTLRTVRNPVVADKNGPAITRAGPLLGEHTVEILHDLGYADDKIEALKNNKVVRAAA
jgi:crotonobetainyl-CoA:carnitine CoA-transferase CaiB-like acyl-CoA transferase